MGFNSLQELAEVSFFFDIFILTGIIILQLLFFALGVSCQPGLCLRGAQVTASVFSGKELLGIFTSLYGVQRLCNKVQFFRDRVRR